MMPQNERVELLQKIFENTNNWLQFAEAKNAALIALNVALIAAVIGSDLYKTCLLLSSLLAVALSASTICVLWSFKPINTELKKIPGNGVLENLLRYAYIATLNRDEYLQKLYKGYWGMANVQNNTIPQVEKDYCQEIIENARITVRKQKYFKIGFYIDLFILILLGVSIICA